MKIDRFWLWWCEKLIDGIMLAILAALASGPLSEIVGIPGWGLAFGVLFLLAWAVLNVIIPIMEDRVPRGEWNT